MMTMLLFPTATSHSLAVSFFDGGEACKQGRQAGKEDIVRQELVVLSFHLTSAGRKVFPPLRADVVLLLARAGVVGVGIVNTILQVKTFTPAFQLET